MTSLEFIEKEINYYKQKKDKAVEWYVFLIEHNGSSAQTKRAEEEKDAVSNYLDNLLQIKNILEAWEELNKLFIIKPYYQDKENNKHPAIMIQHKIEKDFEYVRRGCKQKSFDTIKNALDVRQ